MLSVRKLGTFFKKYDKIVQNYFKNYKGCNQNNEDNRIKCLITSIIYENI